MKKIISLGFMLGPTKDKPASFCGSPVVAIINDYQKMAFVWRDGEGYLPKGATLILRVTDEAGVHREEWAFPDAEVTKVNTQGVILKSRWVRTVVERSTYMYLPVAGKYPCL